MRTECSRASPRRDSAGWPEDRPGTEALARELVEVGRGVAVPEDLAAAQAEEADLVEAPGVVPVPVAVMGLGPAQVRVQGLVLVRVQPLRSALDPMRPSAPAPVLPSARVRPAARESVLAAEPPSAPGMAAR